MNWLQLWIIFPLCFKQTFVRITGHILTDIATAKWLPATRGSAARVRAPPLEPISPASTARKKMSTFKVYTVVNGLGWACLTSTQKGLLCGVTEHLWTLVTGRKISQTTFTIRIVFILSASFKIVAMNGMISIVVTVTGLLARKVGK